MVCGVIAHDPAWVDTSCFPLFGKGGDKPIHLAAIDLIHHRLMTVRRTFFELSIRERKRRKAPTFVRILLATMEPINICSLLTVTSTLFAQRAEHMIKGTVLHHQHDNV